MLQVMPTEAATWIPQVLPACPCGNRYAAREICTSGCRHSRPACAVWI